LKQVRWRTVIDRTATARIQRLIRWLEPFQRCFGHRAQRLALETYVHGLFSDSDRKSIDAPEITRNPLGFLPSNCASRCGSMTAQLRTMFTVSEH
jgi:hypothetical protein